MSKYDITRFNTVIGNPPKGIDAGRKEIWDQLKLQAKLVKEEATELFDASEEEDLIEYLDGMVDVWFLNNYVEDLLEALGVDVKKAKSLVCDNNNGKFSRSLELITKSAKAHNDNGNPCYTQGVKCNGDYYYVVKRVLDNKVQKPLDFVAVDLKPCIPEDVLLKLSLILSEGGSYEFQRRSIENCKPF